MQQIISSEFQCGRLLRFEEVFDDENATYDKSKAGVDFVGEHNVDFGVGVCDGGAKVAITPMVQDSIIIGVSGASTISGGPSNILIGEVKECAISCMVLVISILGDQSKKELSMCLPLLMEQLCTEITRLTAVKAFATIAESPLKIDLSSVLEQVVTELTTFLPKAYSNKISPSSYESIVTELSSLISDVDSHMTALALELCCPMMVDKQHHVNVGMSMREHALPQTLVLVKSSLLQGQPLQMLQGFFAELVQSANTSFKTLLESLISTTRSAVAPGGPVRKQAFYSIAQCVAMLCLADGDAECS
ncbi:unnamed protein product [Sphagnum jensenii]|uniref:Uncharacterized protein n=1 Tax=Sphagnum jensenii TaxID=128206 RepID=A0ABP1A4V9_9BRYO